MRSPVLPGGNPGTAALRRWTFAIAVVALVVRLEPVIAHHALRGVLQYDDGVYFSGAQHLVAGELPYRDFLLLHPPAILVLGAPFAALAHLLPDSTCFALARLVFVGIGVANTLLVARLLRPFGLPAVIGGAGLYAVWSAPAGVERTVLLEPVLNLSLLAALLLLSRDDGGLRRVAVAGAMLGVAAAFKIWAGPEILALAVWLAIVRGRRAAGAWLAGAAAAALIAVGPFLALAPSQMYEQVVQDQAQRAAEGTDIPTRLRYFVGLNGVPGLGPRLPAWFVTGVALVAIAVVLMAAWRGGQRRVRLWALLLGVQMAELLVAAGFFSAYTGFAAPMVCLIGGFVVAWAAAAVKRTPRRALSACGLVLLALLAVSAVRVAISESFPNEAVSRFVSRHRCVWARDPASLILADANRRQIAAGCEQWVDPLGHLVVYTRGSETSGSIFLRAPTLEAWQAAMRSQLRHSDAAIVAGSAKQQGWDSRTAAFFRSRFRRQGHARALVFWVARSPRQVAYALEETQVAPRTARAPRYAGPLQTRGTANRP